MARMSNGAACAAADASHSPLTSYTADPAFRALAALVHLACRAALNELPFPRPHTALLTGPTGTGKTSFLRHVAQHYQLSLHTVTGSLVLIDAGQLRQVMSAAVKEQPSVIVIETIDALASPTLASLRSLVLSLTNDVRVIVIGTTQSQPIDKLAVVIDSTFEDQFVVSVPTRSHRITILNHLLAPIIDNDGDRTMIGKLIARVSDRCQGMTGADLRLLLSTALRRAVNHQRQLPSYEDFSHALDTLTPTLTATGSEGDSLIRTEADRRLTFDDVVGCDDAKNRLHECITAITQPHSLPRGLRAPVGMLLYGPPGTGKTLLAQCLASMPALSFFSLSLATLLRAHVGESERVLTSLFAKAQSLAPSVVFIDEIDALFTSRDSDSASVGSNLVSVLATLMDDIDRHRLSVLVLATSNLPYNIDRSLIRTGRFDWTIYVGLPSTDNKLALIHSALVKRSLSFTAGDSPSLASAVSDYSDGFSAADVVHWVNIAATATISAQSNTLAVSALIAARSKVTGSTTPALIEKLRAWH